MKGDQEAASFRMDDTRLVCLKDGVYNFVLEDGTVITKEFLAGEFIDFGEELKKE